MAGADAARVRGPAAGLTDVLRGETDASILVASSDLRHYAGDGETRPLDAITLAALEGLDPAKLYETVARRHITMILLHLAGTPDGLDPNSAIRVELPVAEGRRP